MNMDVQISQVRAFNLWGICLITEPFYIFLCHAASPGGAVVKNLPAGDARDPGLIPRSGRFPGVVVVQSLSSAPVFATHMNCSTLGFPVLHHLPKFAQTHVH